MKLTPPPPTKIPKLETNTFLDSIIALETTPSKHYRNIIDLRLFNNDQPAILNFNKEINFKNPSHATSMV